MKFKMFYKYISFLSVIFLIGINSSCSVQLNFKEFLGDEPLTPRKVVDEVLKYFQQDDPRGIPVLKIPESINLKGPVQASQIVLNDVTITGHSRISLEYLDVNLEKLQFQVRINIPRLEIIGQYLWEGWWTNSEGDANVTFINLDVGATVDFGINDNGVIEVIDLNAMINPESFLPHFTGLTQVHSVALYTAESTFDSVVVPLIQSKIREGGLTAINKRLEKILENKPFPVDISPVDYLIAKTRSDIVRKKNLDPFRLKEVEKNYFGTSIVLKSVELRGLSTLHRSDIIRTEMVDGRIYLTIELGTQRLRGSTDWTVYTSLLPIGSGHAEIIIDSLRVSVEANKTLMLDIHQY
ncbi:UNVERIFIED_CONTAM: hypothetical protein RMT77_001266 [Armadillidium vulgare]